MELRSLFVNLDGTSGCDRCMDAAISIASAHAAHLTAIYCIGQFSLPDQNAGRVPDGLQDLGEEGATSMLADFAARAERAGISYEAHRTHAAGDSIANEIAANARYADLAIVGQVNADDPPAAGRHVVEHVVLGSGRPVLVIPRQWSIDHQRTIGRNVMVAWDAGREAARAVNDALPLLERADRVDLTTVNARRDIRRYGEEPGAGIALHLARHDVRTDVRQFDTRGADAGNVILSRVAEQDSDLVVMGFYAHSRLREFVLGGVTRTVLGHMTVPVLMSH